MEKWVPACFLYALSAYLLIVLCVRLPAGIRGVKNWLEKHPKIAGMLKNEELKFSLELYFEQFLNFAYGIFKIISGVVIGSAWDVEYLLDEVKKGIEVSREKYDISSLSIDTSIHGERRMISSG